MEKKKPLFREEALEAKRQKQIEELMVVVNPKGWLAITIFCLSMVGILIWSWVGRIPAEAIGQSIVINQSNNFTIDTLQDGQIAEIFVHEGGHVQEGELIALIENPNVDLELADVLFQQEILRQQIENFTAYHHLKTEAEMKAIHESISSDEWEIYRLTSEIEYFKKDLVWKKELFKEGLVALPQINEVVRRIHQNENAIDRAQTNILDNKAKLTQLGDILQFQRYRNESEQLSNKVKAVELKKEQLKIKAPFSGIVISVPVNQKAEVKKGQMIAWIEPDGMKDQVIYGYFLAQREQQIKPGMMGHVQLNSIDSQKYGSLVVQVDRVWSFPVSTEEVFKTIGNRQLVNLFTKNGENAPVQIVCTPIRDPNTPSGFKWSSLKGPPQKIDTGSMGEIRIVVEEKRPIEFVFPFFRTITSSVGR